MALKVQREKYEIILSSFSSSSKNLWQNFIGPALAVGGAGAAAPHHLPVSRLLELGRSGFLRKCNRPKQRKDYYEIYTMCSIVALAVGLRRRLGVHTDPGKPG
jgi:hypothetical protein